MAAFFLHRVTKEYLQFKDERKVSLPEPIENYVENPDIDALVAAAIPQMYWAVDPDDSIREMTLAEKSAVDAAETVRAKDAIVTQLDRGFLKALSEAIAEVTGVTPQAFKAIVRRKLDE